jgi:hypothetical protein
MTKGDTITSRGKQEALARKNKCGTSGAAAAVEATAMQHWQQLWWTTGGGGGIGGDIGNGIGRTVATVG